MTYASATAFRAALDSRLRNLSNERHIPVSRLRKLLVFERVLARLLVVAPDRWIVKGGVALDLRIGDQARATKDLDLARRENVEAADQDMLALKSIDLGDFFDFAVTRSAVRKSTGEDASIRYRVMAKVDNRRFEVHAIDVGFDYSFEHPPERLQHHSLLDFVGIPPLQIPALPLERHLAEKLHAYTRTYKGGLESSRVKDFIDIILIGGIARFSADQLVDSIAITFAVRATHDRPFSLPVPPTSWEQPFLQLATETNLELDVNVGHAQAAAFLDPILAGMVTGDARWDPATWRWRHSSDPSGSGWS